MGVEFGFNSAMFKYSRNAETQSDRIAIYVLYDAGYDPKSMAIFFMSWGRNSRIAAHSSFPPILIRVIESAMWNKKWYASDPENRT